MTYDLAAQLPELLPLAITWAQARAVEIMRGGRALDSEGIEIAREMGVLEPERVRVKLVRAIPLPDESNLRRAAMYTGLLGPHIAGLTLGHGIYIVKAQACMRLLSHELRHVHQYEAAGSIAAFLSEYLKQIAEVGYERAPYEIDALAWERDG
jgi:hypothetical protein